MASRRKRWPPCNSPREREESTIAAVVTASSAGISTGRSRAATSSGVAAMRVPGAHCGGDCGEPPGVGGAVPGVVHGDGQLQAEPWHADDGHQAEGGGECAEVGRVEPPGGQHRHQVGQAVDEDAGQGDADSRRAQTVGPSARIPVSRRPSVSSGRPGRRGAHVMSDRAGCRRPPVGSCSVDPAWPVRFDRRTGAAAGTAGAAASRRGPAYGPSSGGGGKPESAQGDDDRELQQGVGVPLRRLEVEPPGEQDERAGEPRLDGPADRPGPAWVGCPGQAAWAGYRQHEASRDQQAADESARQHQRGGADGQQRQGSGDPTTASRYGGRRGAPGGLPGGQHREEDHHRQQDAAEQKARSVRRVRGEAEYHLPGGAGGKNPALLPSVHHQRLQRPPADGRLPAGVGVLPHGEYAVDGVIGHPYPSFGGCPGADLDGAGDRRRGRRGRPRHQGDPSRRGELARCGHEAVLPAAQVKLSGRGPPAWCRPASRAVRAGRGVCRGAWWSPGTRRSAASDPTRRPASGVRRGAV